MWQNEILDEIHKIREEHAKIFNYDLEAMFADWQKKEADSNRPVVNLSAKRNSASSAESERSKNIKGITEDARYPSTQR
ncbi:hypothetical protein GS597_09780 [Synechococcales cyanobacterium C]|uniref:Uncharacterized protein n=1 Tax=Petrachloros mirabilis ULC683 TaxID=2781853 RepID=A0A8K1ZZ77_9CYAN|nr:hypothetical protein [Petrachloros mirabilis]NCJ06793.1 hypothetical protein [Petrachloros mirabilis ULC683]